MGCLCFASSLAADAGALVIELADSGADGAAGIGGKMKCDPQLISDRIKIISPEILQSWKDGRSGPWTYAAIGQGNDLIIDEIHNFCRAKGRGVAERNRKWEDWLGEVRHEGWCRVVFMTQDVAKVGKPITEHAELRFELTNAERRRDPLFRIPMGDWYQLRASFTRRYNSTISIVEYRKSRGKMVQEQVERVVLDPFWWPFYDSHAAGGGGSKGGQGAKANLRQWEVRPPLFPRQVTTEPDLAGKTRTFWQAPLWVWFVKSNWWRLVRSGAVAAAVLWVSALGGGKVLMDGYMSYFMPAPKVSSVAAQPSGKEPTVADEFKSEADKQAVPKLIGHPPASEVAAMMQRLSQKDRELLMQELQAGSDDYRRLDDQRRALVNQMSESQSAVKVVALTRNEAWFTDPPCSCKIGKVLEDGPHKGKLVKKISIDDGFVELSDGVRIFVGRGVEPPGMSPVQQARSESAVPARPAGTRGAQSFVPGALRPVGGSAVVSGGGGGGEARHNLGAGNADRSLLATPGQSSGNVGSGGGGSGGQDGNSGAAQSTDK